MKDKDQGKVTCKTCGAVAKNTAFGDDWQNRKLEGLRSPVRTPTQILRARQAERIRRQNEKAQ